MTREEASFILANIDRSVCDEELSEALDVAIEALKHEPKTGHWVNGDHCSECGCDVPAYVEDWKWERDMNAKFCPNCGARMQEVEE